MYKQQFKKANKTDAGLTKKDKFYKEGLIKGRIAETLIEELFLSLDFDVCRFGMENTVPTILKNFPKDSEVEKKIRRMPDFVVRDPRSNECYFIEVKYRGPGVFNFDAKFDYYPKETYFVLVSKKHIKCVGYNEFKSKGHIGDNDKCYLGDCPAFKVNKRIIVDYCNFAKKFFENV